MSDESAVLAAKETFRISVDTVIAATPEIVFGYISDLTRSGEWSPECRGGSWTSGAPAEIGSVFTARNYREPDVVAWAPVVRGEWTTRCEIVESTAPQVFCWAMLDSVGRAQQSVWSFEIAGTAGGSVLTHAFLMGELTEGMRGILSDMSSVEEQRFIDEWANKLAGDMRRSITRIKAVLEQSG